MVYTEDDLVALKAALVSGATLVHIGDREVRYRSQKEILEAIRMIEDQISAPADVPDLIQASYSRNTKTKKRC